MRSVSLREQLARAVEERRRLAAQDRPRAGAFAYLNQERVIHFATCGRKSGLPRVKFWISHVADGDTLYLLEEVGARADWVKNALAQPLVDVWARDEVRCAALARVVVDPVETERALRLLERRHDTAELRGAHAQAGLLIAFDAV